MFEQEIQRFLSSRGVKVEACLNKRVKDFSHFVLRHFFYSFAIALSTASLTVPNTHDQWQRHSHVQITHNTPGAYHAEHVLC